MKNLALATAVLLSLGLAACKGNNEQAPASATSTAPETSTPASATVAGKPLPEALPQGVAIDFPYHFIARKAIAASDGKEARLRYTLEYLEGDAASVTASLAGSMMKAGFQSGRWQARPDGRILFIANKAGYGQMQANISQLGKRKPHNAGAKGIVTLGWPSDAIASGNADKQEAESTATE